MESLINIYIFLPFHCFKRPVHLFLPCWLFIRMTSESAEWNPSVRTFDRNFGRSLLAGFSDHYMSNFVLHGTSDVNLWPKLLSDLQMSSQVTKLLICLTVRLFTINLINFNATLKPRINIGRFAFINV